MHSNAMVGGLDHKLLSLILDHVEAITLSAELSAIVAEISRRYPKHLRVKELFETLALYTRVGQAIYEQWRVGNVETIYEFACGHGLLGVLLAYRFPKLPVICIDLEKRPAFDHYLEVARDAGVTLQNIAYIEGDFRDHTIAPNSFVVCIHACNEATEAALEMAVAAGAHYAAMPCCIRDGIYFRRINHLDDQQRYAVAAGYIAGRFDAYKVTAIDERITNRNLVVLGGGTDSPQTPRDSSHRSCSNQATRDSLLLAPP
jgi:hypothetical protein